LFAGKGTPSQPVGQRNAVNYLSTYDNKLLRKFRGHADRVTSISMCPADDTFLSSSADRTVRLWNVQAAACLAECKLPSETTGSPVAVFDGTGLVFCVSAKMDTQQGHYLHLYDARNYNAGAFAELKVAEADLLRAIQSHVSTTEAEALALAKADWRRIQFNQSGDQILVSGDKGLTVVLDGFEGTVQRVFVNKSERAAVACFSADDKTVLEGNDDGTIRCWNIESGVVVQTLEGHVGPINCLAANPKYAQIASSCKDTALWIW
jgi:WD40 repeat protein